MGRCVRTPDYLYSVYAPGVNGGEAAASDTYADDFLYDLKADPWQLNNVVADPAYAQAKADMRAPPAGLDREGRGIPPHHHGLRRGFVWRAPAKRRNRSIAG